MSVWVIKRQAKSTFSSQTGGWDAVLGARGAKLQLVLNAIFHLEASPGNVTWQEYLDIAKSPMVKLAVPIAVGDNYYGYRLVGTMTNLFTEAEYIPGRRLTPKPGGRIFDQELREAVVGSYVAQQLKLVIGSHFKPFHGLNFDPTKQHDDEYVVVGLLEPSNTPADRVIWIPLEGLQNMTGHSEETSTDVSAVLLKLRSPIAGQQLDLKINRQETKLTLAWPIGMVTAQLFDKLGWLNGVLELVAYLVAVVAGASVLASIYNSMNSRRRDIAILRALGARRSMVFSAIVAEAAAIGLLGAVVGVAVYGVIMTVVVRLIQVQTGVVLDALAFDPVFLGAPAGLVLISAAAGVVPAWKAYRTPVAENLIPES
jgi:putative ABC transport system permease protein